MGTATFSFRVMSMMAVVFAATTGYFAVPALRIVGRRFIDVEWFLGILMRSAWTALADARWRLCRSRHGARSLLAILLIALMSGVLRGIASLSLLSGVPDVAAALLDLMGMAGFGITGPPVALIVRRHGRGLGNCRLHCACHRTNAR
jgi:hypothetical protein